MSNKLSTTVIEDEGAGECGTGGDVVEGSGRLGGDAVRVAVFVNERGSRTEAADTDM